LTDYPKLFQIKQKFAPAATNNISERISSEIAGLKLSKRIGPGDKIAVTAGSRGITGIDSITRTVIGELIKPGGKPFIIPAMGSHGGATAEGQLGVLAGHGITEDKMGVPIISSMEVVKVGESKEGIPVYVDKNAVDADHVVVINRIKPHTRFSGKIESGLIKMLLVGLGKDVAAGIYHRALMKYSFDRIIDSVLPILLSRLPVLFGLAIVENAYGGVANIKAINGADIIDVEPMLKKESLELMPKLPFKEIDLLIVDEMGKDISGTGMDTNIIGRKQGPAQTQDMDEEVRITRIFVRDLTDKSCGNACGIGLADFTTRRLVKKINEKETNINCIAALRPEGAKVPMTFDCDKDAIDAAISTCGMDDTKNIKIVRIKNTLDLNTLIASEAYLDDLENRDGLEQISPVRELVFDSSNNLESFNI